ncbi:complement C1r subcomponent-like [Aedes albopictus]|uniref:Peptidase S1 domain-containing protein n=1 Tax=Aedes albopictus TaxID=7160 RepID=A0ABM1YXN0_AEDAL
MMCHPDFNSANFQNDIGVVRLSTAVTLSSKLVPACLANSLSENHEDAMLQTRLLHVGDVFQRSSYDYIGTKDECDKLIKEPHLLKPGQACLINPSSEMNKFNGSIVQMVDSRTCRFTVTGIGSTAIENPDISSAHRVGIVHRIDHYLDWIEKIVWEKSFHCAMGRPLVATSLFRVRCV